MNSLIKISCLFIGYLICSASPVTAQDLVVTMQGDSINGKITKENSTQIYFTYKRDREFVRTMLPKRLVKSYRFAHFPVAEVPGDVYVLNQVFPRFRGGVYGGWTNRFSAVPANLPPELDDYQSALKTGFHFGGDVASYFTEGLGFGLRYSAFRSGNETDITLLYDDGTSESGMLSDQIAVHYVGPFFSRRVFGANKQNCFLLNFGAGLIRYQNQGMLIDPLNITGNAFGFSWDFAYDISIAKNLALGVQASFVLGNLKTLNYSYRGITETVNLSKDDYENLSRIDLSLGLRFIK